MAFIRSVLILAIYAISITSLYSQTDNSTTFFFIRHAEKIRNGDSDPNLTEEGMVRSRNWAEVFKNVDFDAIYSTNTQRTLNTAKPTADNKNLDIVVYDSKMIDMLEFAKINEGKTILIVGHSNTTPVLVNELLGEEKYSQIEDNNNGNLYVVTILEGISTAELLHLD